MIREVLDREVEIYDVRRTFERIDAVERGATCVQLLCKQCAGPCKKSNWNYFAKGVRSRGRQGVGAGNRHREGEQREDLLAADDTDGHR
jgi:hypothetical protein